MNTRKYQRVHLLRSGLLLALVFLNGCGQTSDYSKWFFQENEIVSYERVDTSKTVIRIGNLINANTTPLEEALEQKYPDITFISTVGGSELYIRQQGDHDDLTDIIFYAFAPGLSEYFYDLSAESFTERYNQTSLDALSVNGKLYQLPIASSCFGIFYNKDLFAEHGWEIPKTQADFYTLCQSIEAEGIRAYAPCLKYDSTVAEVGLGESNRAIFGSVDSTRDFYAFTDGIHSSEGVMEPFLEGLQNLRDRGLIHASDFATSATQIRHSLYNGETAMIPYAMNFMTFYDDEKAKAEAEGRELCEIGFMGFPTDEEDQRYLSFSHEASCMALSKASMQDKKKREILLDLFDFFSTNEGQEILFKCFTGVSSLKSYQTTVTTRFEEVEECMREGRMYFPARFWDGTDIDDIKKWFNGEYTNSEMLTKLDHMVAKLQDGGAIPETFAMATETFTRLETTMFMADCFKETTDADIGLMLDNTLFSGNLMKIYQGDIYSSGVFYLRGASSQDYLSVYDISGANLKELLEHPYVKSISSQEINTMYGFSGLKMTYAPWKDKSMNITSLTMEDGTPIIDNQIYKVAAWDLSIDERYMEKDNEGQPIVEHTEYNHFESYFIELLTEKGVISPKKYRDGRLTLDWKY